VRELDFLAEAFGELEHLAPLYSGDAPASMISYENINVEFTPLQPSGGDGLSSKIGIIKNYPHYLSSVRRAIKQADVVQVRCPCNIAIPALIYLAIEKRTPRWAKYAGNWIQERAPLSYRFQRWWLKRRWHYGFVTVNGKWPNQPKHIFSFHNPCLTSSEIQKATQITFKKELKHPLQLLYVGRVETAKGIGRVLEVVSLILKGGVKLYLNIIGDGPERKKFEAKAAELNINEYVQFHGWLPKHALTGFYAQAHFFLLPSSASEGFPKVISEAMAYGVVPIVSAVSCIPEVLKDVGSGYSITDDNPIAYADKINSLISNPAKWKKMSEKGKKCSLCFTYEYYIRKLKNMLGYR
jgi:glycosyltransferase involved in cell wall biosynthesis